jgi:hypothetical protein
MTFAASGSNTFSSSGGTDLVASGSSASFFISASVVRGTGGEDLAASGSGDCSSLTPSAFFFISQDSTIGGNEQQNNVELISVSNVFDTTKKIDLKKLYMNCLSLFQLLKIRNEKF